MSYKITCRDCGQPIDHICDENFRDRLIRLLSWVPEGFWSSPEMAEAFKAESKRQEDDYNFEHYPFFGSQAWTYLIWHKEDARTFHALLNNLIRAAGIDPDRVEIEIRKKIREAEERRAAAEERAKKRRAKKAEG